MRRIRADDERPAELLAECGRESVRLGLAVAWTTGIVGEKAKQAGPWKDAKPFADREQAAGFYVQRCRTRNPLHPVGASGLVGIEIDGDEQDLRARYGIPAFPETVRVVSRRGVHVYLRAPEGRSPMKVEISESKVTRSEDGVLIGAGALHPSGHVYAYNGHAEIAACPAQLFDQLERLAGETAARRRVHLAEGGVIHKGEGRADFIFQVALELAHDGLDDEEILPAVAAINRRRCVPPLPDQEVLRQVRGSVVRARRKPRDPELEQLGLEAERELEEWARKLSGGARGSTRSRARRRRRALDRRPLRQIAAEHVEWAIDRIIPLGTLSLLAGVGGLGKSALLLAWAKEITAAGGDVLIVSYEDAAAQVIRPRFEALGGDLDRLHVLYVDVLDGSVSFPTDLPELDRHIRETQARAVLIDPISASIDLKLDAHKDQDVRVVLGQLAQLAERQRLAIPMNAHLNKAPSSDPYLRINGSTAFYNAARSVLTVTRDPAEPDWQRLVAHHKSNYGQLAEVERWLIKPTTAVCNGIPIETMVMEFVEIADDISRDDVLASHPAGDAKLDAAVAFLESALADGEWHDSAGLKTLAVGIHERMLQRAAQELDVEHERRGFPSSTYWRRRSRDKPSPHNVSRLEDTA